MHKIYLVATNTFREIIRDKILYTIFIFAILLILSSQLFGTIAMQAQEKITVDFGLAMIEIFNLIITLFVGSSLVYKEVEKKLVYFLFSKPLSRTQFILGKYCGLSLILLLLNILMFACFTLMAGFKLAYAAVIGFIFVQSLFVLAIILFFSAFISPVLALFLSLLTYLIGQISINLKMFALYNGGKAFKFMADAIYFLMPNLSLLNLKNQVIYALKITPLELGIHLIYAILYTILLLFVTIKIFNRQEF